MARLTGVLTCLLALALAAPAVAEKRVALVIGNVAYKHAPALPNVKNDAEAMAAALRRLNFEVALGVDLDKAGIEQKLRELAARIEPGGITTVYFAGHSVLTKDGLFLVPVEAKVEKESDLLFVAVQLETVLRAMTPAAKTPPPPTRGLERKPEESHVRIVLLDGALDNPLADANTRAPSALHTAIAARTLVGFAALPGETALDGPPGKNSPYTAALLDHIETPGLEIHQLLTRVAASVEKATGGRQVPWVASSLSADFHFAPPKAAVPEQKK